MNKIKKTACYTDIHLGKRNNSVQHNQDCLDFIAWFCAKVKADPGISHVVFLGDFFESRSNISILTLHMAYEGLKMLNDLGLPIIHIVGNHDLYRRSTREIHSIALFNEFENFIVVDKPTMIGDSLFLPYLFEDEYKTVAAEFKDAKYWYGHLEFKNFMVTGYNTVMKHGPDHRVFNKPKYIFSGHFHKRQALDNVIYIGNVFPLDFGDAGDEERGMMTCDHLTGDVQFENWEDCPKFMKVNLSEILAGNWKPKSKTRVKCVVDVNITYSEAQVIREALIEEHELRELSLEESSDKDEALEGDDQDLIDDGSKSLDELIIESLEGITDATTIDNEILIEQYKAL